ncbi:MAG: carboxypeptidase regulatory-like domain-containing protein [Myxococcota bacterium]
MLLLLVAVLAGRYASQRAEHLRLREAEATRAPRAAKRSTIDQAAPSAPPSGGCVRGVVLERGLPVAGMQISVSDAPSGVSGDCPCPKPTNTCGCRAGLAALVGNPRLGLIEGVASTTSGADGRFELCGLVGGAPRLLWGEHADGRFARPRENAPQAVTPGSTAVLEVEHLVRVEGVVLADRSPVTDAVVVALGRPALFARRATTDAHGRFSLSLLRGLARFVVVAAGHPVQDFERAIGSGAVSLELQGEGALVVLATHDGRPVPGAEVVLGAEPPLLTGADGAVTAPLPAGERLKLRATKGELVGSATVEVRAGTQHRVEVPLVKGVRVRGVVRDELGAPRQAKVRGLGTSRPLLADPDGHFISPPLEPRVELHPVASAEGCHESPWQTLALAEADLEATLVVACVETVSGLVLDADGQPVADAFATLRGLERSETVTTDAAGRFAHHLPPGDYQLSVTHERYRKYEQPLHAPAKDVTVVLDAGGSISGRVTNAKGEPVAGAEVGVVPAVLDELLRDVEGGLLRRVTTDGEGRFEVTGLLAGRLVVSATIDTEGTAVSEPVSLQPGEHREGVEVRFGGRVDLRGTVLDERRRPIAGARVTWGPVDEKSAWMGVFTDVVRGRVDSVLEFLPSGAVSDVEGRFELHSLPIARVKLTVSASGFATLTRESSKGDTLELVLSREGGVVRGRVVDETGRAVPRFEVNGVSFTPTDGRFELEAHDDEAHLSVTARGFTRTQLEAKLEHGEKDVGDVVLRKGFTLLVEAHDDEGRPLEGVRVAASQRGGGDTCETKQDGRCEIDSLARVETLVKASKQGHRPARESVRAEQLDAPVRLSLPAVHGRVLGQAFGPGARPLASRTLAVAGEVDRSVMTDAQGRFSADGLPDGRYCISLELPGGRMFEWAVPALASAQPAEVTVGPVSSGARLEGSRVLPGRLVLLRGTPGPRALSSIADQTASALCEASATDAIVIIVTGDFVLEGIPPGTWSVYFVSITQVDEQGQAEPTVLTLLPRERRRLD